MTTALTNKQKNPTWFTILNLLFLLPIVVWPIVFFATLFMFDNPNGNGTLMFLLFMVINAYPLYLVVFLLLNARLFRTNKTIAIIMPIAFNLLLSVAVAWVLLDY